MKGDIAVMERSVVEGFDPGGLRDVPEGRLEAEARSLASAVAAVTCRWLLVVAELDRRESWRSWGCRGMTHWLSWKCGMSEVTGRHHLDVARKLAGLPVIRARFAAGTLSFSKVRALCRVATPETESALVGLADSGTAAQLERMLRAYERAVRPADVRDAERHRGVWFDGARDDGTCRIRINATPETYALVRARLAELIDDIPPECVEGADEPSAARRHDALERLVTGPEPAAIVVNLHAELADIEAHLPADTVTATPDATAAGGPAGPAPEPQDWSDDRLGFPPTVAPDLVPRRHVSPVMARLLGRIGCDARARFVIDDHGASIDLGRTCREPGRPLRRYVLRRDRYRCRWAGCDHAAEHVHHIWHWTHGGPTDRANLVSVCRYHHRLLHPGRWWITGNPETHHGLTFHAPAGHTIGEHLEPLPENTLDARTLVDDPTGHCADTRYYGNPMDLDLAITALISLLRPPARACAAA